jgi:hypothetical protein
MSPWAIKEKNYNIESRLMGPSDRIATRGFKARDIIFEIWWDLSARSWVVKAGGIAPTIAVCEKIQGVVARRSSSMPEGHPKQQIMSVNQRWFPEFLGLTESKLTPGKSGQIELYPRYCTIEWRRVTSSASCCLFDEPILLALQ